MRALVVSSSRSLSLLAPLLLSACFSSDLTLRNQTGKTLTPYPVVTDPPPPHREADPAGEIAAGATAALDIKGFNPVFYAGSIDDETKANGLFLGFDLQDEGPDFIQYKVVHYRVPPGEEGTDPAQQPIELKQGIFEVEDVDQEIRVRKVPISPGSPPPPGGWEVTIDPK